jgi:hypothetical protein
MIALCAASRFTSGDNKISLLIILHSYCEYTTAAVLES